MITLKRNYFETSTLPNKYQTILWALGVILAVLLSLRNYQSFQIGTYLDDSEYAVLAQSFVQSDTYGLINIPGQSIETRYPFGYPLIIAPMAALFPNNLDALKIPSLIATILNASLLFWGWRWFSRGLSYWLGLATTVLYLLTPLTIGHTRMVMSEPIFTTFCLASIILIERARYKHQGFVMSFLLSLCLFFTVITRTVGLALIMVVFVYLPLTRRKNVWKELIFVTTGMIALLLIIIAATPLTVRNVFNFRDYTNQFISPSSWGLNSQEDTILTRFSIGTEEYLVRSVRQTVFPLGGGEKEQIFSLRLGLPFLPVLIGLTFTALIVLGYFRWLSIAGLSVSLSFSVVYIGIMIMWPWRGPRFLYPIQPQLYLGLLLGVEVFLSQIASKLRKGYLVYNPLLVMTVLGLALLNLYKNLPLDDSRNHVGDHQAHSSWFKQNSEESAIVMTEEPQTDYLYSGRKTIPSKEFRSFDELETYLLDNNVDYILLATDYQWQAVYSPLCNPDTLNLLQMLETMALDGRVKLVYSYDPQLVKIFKVLLSKNQGG